MRHLRPLVAGGLLAGAVALCSTPAGALPPGLEPVPYPTTTGLEAAVAAQLEEGRHQLDAVTAAADTTPAELASAFGRLGQLYQAYDLGEAAEACYRNARKLAPRTFRWAYYLGYLYQQSGRFEEAAAAYDQALALEPRNLPALVHLAEVRLEQNRATDAEGLLARALEVDPSSPAAKAVLGQIALSRGQYRNAVDLLEEALARLPDANRLQYSLGLAYRGLGELDKAREHLSQRGLVGARPPDPLIDELQDLKEGETAHLLRGRLAYRAGRFDTAAQEFRKAAAAQPNSVPARINLAAALEHLGDRARAVSELREALRLAPDNVTAHFNLGSLLADSGDAREALEHLQAAVRLAPDDGQAQQHLADLLRRTGDPEAALPHYAEARRLSPQVEGIRIGEADALAALGRFGEALQRLEQAHALMPDKGLTAHALARLLAACPDPGLRDGPRALDLATRVFKARPTPLHAETVAMALAEVGRCDEAARWQRRAIEALPDGTGEDRRNDLERTLAHYESGPPCRFGLPTETEPSTAKPR